MHYFDTSRASPPATAVRIRVALDVVEAAARTRVKSSPRLTLSELVVADGGNASLARVGTTADISTLVWEVLAYRAADTDAMPWSDPAEDLPEAVLDAIASLTVRPATSLAELRDRTKPAFEAHASARTDLAKALGIADASVAPLRTPVVPADPGRITMRAPALTVDTLRTISKDDALVPRPAKAMAAPRPAIPAPAPHVEAVAEPTMETPRVPDAAAPATVDPGTVTVAMNAVQLPAAARPSNRPLASEVAAPESRGPASGSRDLPLAPLGRSKDAASARPPSLEIAHTAALPDLPLRVSTTPPLSPLVDSAELGRGTLDPWGDSQSAAPTPTAAPTQRRRLWPFVVLGVAASIALIGVVVQRTSTTTASSPPKATDVATHVATDTAQSTATARAESLALAAPSEAPTATPSSAASGEAATIPPANVAAVSALAAPKPTPIVAVQRRTSTPRASSSAEAAMPSPDAASVDSSPDASPTAATPAPTAAPASAPTAAPTSAGPADAPASGG